MSQFMHNGLGYQIVNYDNDDAVIEVKENGVKHKSFIKTSIDNFDAGFSEWVKENY